MSSRSRRPSPMDFNLGKRGITFDIKRANVEEIKMQMKEGDESITLRVILS